MTHKRLANSHHQSGVVLVISLIMLLAITLIGITSSNVTGLEEKMAANNKDKNLAFQAAEAALRAAEAAIGAAKPASVNQGTRATVIANQGVGSGAGYYTLLQDNAIITNGIQTKNPDPINPAQTPPFYSNYSATTCANCVNWGSTQQSPSKSSPVNSIVYAGATLKGLYNKPEYIIEEIANTGNSVTGSTKICDPSDPTGCVNTTAGNTITFRITAHGWGNSASSAVNVQSIVKVTYPQ